MMMMMMMKATSTMIKMIMMKMITIRSLDEMIGWIRMVA